MQISQLALSALLSFYLGGICQFAQAQNPDVSPGGGGQFSGGQGQFAGRWQSLSPEERQARIARFREMRAGRANGQGASTLDSGNSAASAPSANQNRGVSLAADKPYVLHADLAYGSDRLQKVDIYSPLDSKNPKPIMFFVHGGGWANGDKGSFGAKAASYTKNGIVFVSVNYRLAPNVVHPKQIEDIAAAFAYVKDHAAEYGGDPDRIVIMGHSAGAQLVDLLGTNERFLKEKGLSFKDLKAVVSLDTASLNLITRKDDKGPETQFVGGMVDAAFGTDPKVLADASPTLCIHKGVKYPPFLMYCGSARTNCVAQHKVFNDAMKAAGGQVTVIPIPLSHRDVNKESGKVDSEMFKKIMGLLNS